MDVGMMMVFASYGWDNCSEARVWDEEIRLARLAADWASTACGRPSTTSTTTHLCPTTCS
jgi:hypothetical protein